MTENKIPCSGPGCENLVPGRINVRDKRPVFCGRVCASEYKRKNRGKSTGGRDRRPTLDLK